MTLASRPTARWLDAESSTLIREFWQGAGGEEPYPRTLERPLALALPVTLIKLAHLHLHHAEQWLQARGVSLEFTSDGSDTTDHSARRPVHGCIMAHAGHAFLFVDGADNASEMRFTIAHEIGHFLADHLLPRRDALRHFGAAILPVLDGQRPATIAERLSGALRGIRLDEYKDFLPRSDSADGGLDLWRVESRADRIGTALLAPPDELLRHAVGPTFAERTQAGLEALTSRFGMPEAPARRYVQALLEENGRGPSWAESLRRPGSS